MLSSRQRFLTTAAATVAGTALTCSTVRAAEFEFKFAHDVPQDHPLGIGVREFSEAIAKDTNGRLTFQIFPNSQLGGDASIVTQVRAGGIQGMLMGAPLSSIAPIINIQLIGFAFRSRADVRNALNGALGAVVRKDLDGKGIHVFEKMWENGFRQITTSTRPIRVVDDLAGLKIRVPVSPIVLDMFKALGASPAPLEVKELYTGLQTHVVDAEEGALSSIYTTKLYEVQKYLSITNHGWSTYWFCLGNQAWQSLPADLQAIVTRNANTIGTKASMIGEQRDDETTNLLIKTGMVKNVLADPAPFRARLGAYYAHWKAEFGPTAWAALEQTTGKLG